MRKSLLICSFLLLTLQLFGQANERFRNAMESTLLQMSKLNGDSKPEDWQQIANQFERIGNAEPKEWLPNYWAAYCYNLLGFMGSDASQKDKYLDRATELHKKAEAVAPDNDELYVLKGYIAQARLSIDPMSRWMTYGGASTEALEKAKSLNAANPRPYILQGVSLYYTPEQFGGGKAAACPVLKVAKEKFDLFKPASPIHPNWGDYNLKMVSCN